jgi:3-hydroxybutyryl-CoA dehydrogenase
MGREIGLQCAIHGFEVMLYDTSEEALAEARREQEAILGHLVAEGRLTEAAAAATLERISATENAESAAAEADLLSESVPERPELKREVLARFHELCPPRTVFTTNTSTFVPSMFAEDCGRPAQFASLHFHHPVWIANVADVMPHPGTDPEVVELLESFAWRIGQIPIVCRKENNGYVFNAMLLSLLGSALTLVASEVAPPEDVDRAWMGVMKTPIGPLGIIDSIGIDTAYDVVSYWAEAEEDPQMEENAALLRSFVDTGRLGLKTGEGFYTYPDPAYQQTDFVNPGSKDEDR